ncbi:MAG: flagellar motor switch protein FliN [Rhodospirillales bacterium]|nr:flagellar motor switch protein FliN [Rhodospirillales bacterium]
MGDQDLQLSELEEGEANSTPATELDESNLGNAEAVEIPDIPRNAQDLEAVYDIPVQVSAVLGRSTMEVQELLKLGKGAVVELDRKVGEAIDIFVNNRLVARGEVVVLEDRLGITMTEIIKTDRI